MRNILIALGVVAVLAIVGLAITEYTGPSGGDGTSPPATSAAKMVMPVIGADEFIIGKPEAPITIVEYASLTCPHCARFHTDTLPKLKEKYIEPGKVRLVYRDFPLDRYALQGSMMARCAGPERYLGFIDVMFMTQDSWARADGGRRKAIPKDRMRSRLEKIIKELLESSYSGSSLFFRTALRADGVTNGWKIGFTWNLDFAANLDVMIIPEKQDNDEIRDQIKAEIERKLPSWKKRASA